MTFATAYQKHFPDELIGAVRTALIVTSIVGIVLGFVAKKQIADSGGTQGGDGLALAGIIIGFATLALSILFAVTGNFNVYTS